MKENDTTVNMFLLIAFSSKSIFVLKRTLILFQLGNIQNVVSVLMSFIEFVKSLKSIWEKFFCCHKIVFFGKLCFFTTIRFW